LKEVINMSCFALFVDSKPESAEVTKFLDSLGVKYTAVPIEDPENDPREFIRRKLPVLQFVTIGAYPMTRWGLEEIKSVENAILLAWKDDKKLRVFYKQKREEGFEI